jgi:hypothetical protein
MTTISPPGTAIVTFDDPGGLWNWKLFGRGT